eukprot:CAMPEP_0177768268 /NCGR_PEP_ID=MMETSP0491_2-20121128/9622_1 /TAXON_ID=63592 /ORGANISM="Tetraselmis chuii, Strain PLY429" /LENGTH=51 /DNA_ID=CAMNT_0019285047 /DNA_START=266 /DNA_END=421 /DNA_ORIENTATION=+
MMACMMDPEYLNESMVESRQRCLCSAVQDSAREFISPRTASSFWVKSPSYL